VLVAEAKKPFITDPVAPAMTARGMAVIVEWEGYAEYPEYPGGASGISNGLGFDWSTVSPKVSVLDWAALPAPAPQRLAATYPYTRQAARAHLRDVKDIRAPRAIGFDVFNRVDVPRFYSICKRAFPGFEELRPHARDAILSLVYNRGAGMAGNSRRHMRELPALIKAKNYVGIADCLRRMKVIWIGTDIEIGMNHRREAEAKLVELP
jgi:GH24 family phage-related lysozyme (muramidase)